MYFQEKIRKASEANRSRVVLALDLEDTNRDRLFERSKQILRDVCSYVCAVKINRQLVLSLGLHGGVDSIVKFAHELSLPTIMDAKVNDVRHTNEFMMRSYSDAGFDAIIASPVAGWEGGLDSLFQLAASRGTGVLLLVYMSNPGAEAFYSLKTAQTNGSPKLVFELLAEWAIQWKATGVIVGATRPGIIRRVRELVGSSMDIYSPGVGAQGADPGKALAAGSDYLIVGRAIYGASDAKKAAEKYRAPYSKL